MVRKMWLFIFLLGSCWFSATDHLKAQVLINEVSPQPDSGSDWVELYNIGAEGVSLAGWTLEDVLSSPSVLTTLNTFLNPGEYLVIDVGQKLNNSGDGVTLKNLTGTVLDQMNFVSSTVGKSWSRWPDGTGLFNLVTPTRSVTNAAPSSSPTSSPTPTPTPTPLITIPNLLISEVNACPVSGETEWIELYNPETQPFTLTNWKVRDASQNSKAVFATIPAQGWGVVSWTGSLLNNTGDTVTFVTPTGEDLWELSFEACQTGQSWVFHQNEWRLTGTPTKGAINRLESDTTSPTPTASVSALLNNTIVTNSLANPVASAPTPDLKVMTALKERLASESSHLPPWQAPLLTISPLPELQTTPTPELNTLPGTIPPTQLHLGTWISVILTGVLLCAVSGYQLYGFYKKHLAPTLD
jgi:hypothetical protein